MRVADRGLELYARCASGFEGVLADELRGLGARQVRAQVGGVSFRGRPSCAYRVCLWSRAATRVQLVIGRIPCQTADQMYEGVAALPWEDLVREGATIAVRAHGTNDALRNTAFSALKAKDAVCDRLRDTRGTRPDVDAHDPDLGIDLAVHERKATVYLNLSGASLHRRGYREDGVQTDAPLKETLAAGLLLAAGWPALAREGSVLVDPMCGSGTIAIEAALMAADVAPGLWRRRWGFEGWAVHDAGLWSSVMASAEGRAEEGLATCKARILAGDADARAVGIACDNVGRAQVAGLVQVFCDDACNLGRHLRGLLKRGTRAGLLAVNPPYGERLGSAEDLPMVNAALAAALDALPEAWQAAVITPDAGVDSALGRLPRQTIACHNGPLEVTLRIYDTNVRKGSCEVVSLAGRQRRVPVADERSAQFAARLRKVAKDVLRRSRNEDSTCARLYDADLPDYPYAVDLFEEVGKGEAEREEPGERHAAIEAVRRPRRSQAEQAARRLADARAIVAAVLDIEPTHVHLRGRQARKEGVRASHTLRVRENGLVYCVDLLATPDTGLPLWQHETRNRVREQARNKYVANVGGGTSAATVCAAAGGAKGTVTVEPFEDRAALLRQSLRANGFASKRNRVVCADARTWLERQRRERQQFDLVILALPAWVRKDVRRELAVLAKDVLAKGGSLLVVEPAST